MTIGGMASMMDVECTQGYEIKIMSLSTNMHHVDKCVELVHERNRLVNNQ
jgi:hypothetical protein